MIPFHLAFPVRDIEQTRAFYCGLLGCTPGRSAERWLDFDFFGHQLSAHVADTSHGEPTNRVDGKDVPVRHFGAILPWERFWALAELLTGQVEFIITPYIRFEGLPGEQATMFFCDPAGNAIEFKSFRDPAMIFATEFSND